MRSRSGRGLTSRRRPRSAARAGLGRPVSADRPPAGRSRRGASCEQAMESAYAATSLVRFEGMQYRRDIGRKAIEAEARS